MPKRHCLSHAAGGASCAAWQFRPRGTHRVGLFSLDFLWFFLVSRQERTLNMLFAKILLQALHFKIISPLQGLKKMFAPYKGLRPLAIYYAPSGLKPPDKFHREADKFRQETDKFILSFIIILYFYSSAIVSEQLKNEYSYIFSCIIAHSTRPITLYLKATIGFKNGFHPVNFYGSLALEHVEHYVEGVGVPINRFARF